MGGGFARREATKTVPVSLEATSDCSRKQVMSRGRRDSLSLPGLFQSTARYSHEYSFSLAKNSCTTTNTYHLHIYVICCHFFSCHHPDLQTDDTLCFWTQNNSTILKHFNFLALPEISAMRLCSEHKPTKQGIRGSTATSN